MRLRIRWPPANVFFTDSDWMWVYMVQQVSILTRCTSRASTESSGIQSWKNFTKTFGTIVILHLSRNFVPVTTQHPLVCSLFPGLQYVMFNNKSDLMINHKLSSATLCTSPGLTRPLLRPWQPHQVFDGVVRCLLRTLPHCYYQHTRRWIQWANIPYMPQLVEYPRDVQ